MAPALSDFQPQPAPQATTAAQTAIGDGLVKEAQAFADELAAWRHDLHQIPELGNNLPQTSAYIQARLDEMDIPHTTLVDGSCVVGLIGAGAAAAAQGNGTCKDEQAGTVVMLRGDMDALPVVEESGEPFASTNGCMHACGHDMHATALLGAARLLKAREAELVEANATVKLLFQPGEECNPGGASLVLAEKPFEGYDVRAVVGEHVEPQLEVGTLGFRAGKYMAASDELRFRVRGTGGHGAMRKQLKDPVAAGAELLTRLIALNGEECVLSIGRVEAGGATNIVPDQVYLEGTLRTFDEREREIIHKRIRNFAADIDKRHGVRTDVDISRGYPCVVNDAALVKHAAALAAEAGLRVEMLPLRTTAEDFGFYCTKYPSLFYRLGVGAAAGRPHTATFFPDEAAIGVGIAYMRKLALQLLEK